MKRIKQDDVFSKLVRLRTNYICEACGRHFPDGVGLECSHLFSRRHFSTRWHPLNAAAHCSSCHRQLGENPYRFGEWIRKHLGEDEAERLNGMRQVIASFRTRQKEAIHRHLKAELKRREALRAEGETGRIEFTAAPEIEALFAGWEKAA